MGESYRRGCEKWGVHGGEMLEGLLREHPRDRWDVCRLLGCRFLS